MYWNAGERMMLAIDGANVFHSLKGLGIEIDYRRLLDAFRDKGRLISATYYTTVVDNDEQCPLRPLIDWLDYNGFTVLAKPVKEFVDGDGRRRFKGGIDVELVVDALQRAVHFDHYVLFSGSGEFRRLVDALQQQGKRVSIISTLNANGASVSDELRRQADQFIDLMDLAPLIRRDSAPSRRRTAPNKPVLVDE